MNSRLLLVLLLAILGAGLPFLPYVGELEEKSIDARFLIRGPKSSKAPVIVVAVDDRTERVWNEERHLPKAVWPSELAKIIPAAKQGGAERIGFDFEFALDMDRYLSSKGVDEEPFFQFVSELLDAKDLCVLGVSDMRNIAEALILQEPPLRFASVNRVAGDAGAVRRLPRIDPSFAEPLPSLSAALADREDGRSDPIDINYVGTQPRVVSAIDVIEGRVPKHVFAGAYVLVGETYGSSPDIHDTPVAKGVPGVMIHAEGLRTIIDGSELVVLGIGWAALWIAVVSFVTTLLAQTVWPFRYALIAVSFVALWSVFSQLVFQSFNMILPYASVVLMSLLVVPASVYIVRAIEEYRRRQDVQAEWGRMVSETFVKRVMANRKTGLGSWERMTACLMFLDIADFSTHSNSERQETVVERLNMLFPVAIQEARASGGEVLNFMGDGLSVMWEVNSDDAREATLETALSVALRILSAIDELNSRKAFGEEPWNVRLGIAYGQVMLALVGTEERKQMTLYGSAVNLAARCEQAGKDLWPGANPRMISRLVVTEEFDDIAQKSGQEFRALCFQPKGWKQPLKVYYLVWK